MTITRKDIDDTAEGFWAKYKVHIINISGAFILGIIFGILI
jgi:hypothetical protein